MMAATTFKTEVTWSGQGLMSLADAHGKQFIIDEPQRLGGTDKGPNPLEYLLGSLGGCISVIVNMLKDAHDVDVKALEVVVEGDFDADGFRELNPDIRPGLLEIRYQIHLDSPSPQENIEALLEHVEQICPIKDTLKGVPTKRVQD